MRRKVFIAVAAVAVIGAFFWSQQPQRAPTHERTPTVATDDASTRVDAQNPLETPPTMSSPSDGGEPAGAAGAAPESSADSAATSDARETRRVERTTSPPAFLPPEAVVTLRAIERGGPYPYRQDDGVFQNRERKLPSQPRGYYREYTVKTPGSRDRGARRIIAGGQPPREFFYTDDHYRSFRRFTLDGREGDAVNAQGMELSALLTASDQAGAYFADMRDREDLVEAGNALHFAVVPVDLRGCDSGGAALARIAEALRFPEWFGGNWDALADCVNDLSWWPSEGYVLVLEHASDWRAHDRESFDTALEILGEASVRWAEDRVPFWAFFPVPARELDGIDV